MKKLLVGLAFILAGIVYGGKNHAYHQLNFVIAGCRAAVPTLPFIDHDSSWSIYTDEDDGYRYVQLPFTLYFGASTQTAVFVSTCALYDKSSLFNDF